MPKRSGTQILIDRIASLPEEDAAVVGKWRSEVGEERFIAILKAIAGIPNDGRRTQLENRWHLLIQMGVEIRRSGCAPFTAAKIVQKAADKSRLAIIPAEESLTKWLARMRGKHSQDIFKSIDASRSNRPQLTALRSTLHYMEQTNLLIEKVKQSKLLPSAELMRLVGFHRFMPDEPFRGYKSMMEWSKNDPVMRMLMQSRASQGENEGT